MPSMPPVPARRRRGREVPAGALRDRADRRRPPLAARTPASGPASPWSASGGARA